MKKSYNKATAYFHRFTILLFIGLFALAARAQAPGKFKPEAAARMWLVER